MGFFQLVSYRLLRSEEEGVADSHKEHFLDRDEAVSSELDPDHEDQNWAWTLLGQRPRLKRITIIVASLALVFLSFWAALWAQSQTLQTCLARTSSYSPALEAVNYHETDFANVFDQKSRYRGPPSPELEKAWEDLWNQPEVLIPPHGMAKLNRSGESLNSYMTVPEEEGYGYFGGLEVFHQLHCLNYVRQFTWFLMDKYDDETLPTGFDIPLKALRMHTDHCIETLRIVLMCYSDVSPVLVKWSSSNPPMPEADFSSHHRCRNFDNILAWNKEHAISSWGLRDLQHHH